MDVQTLEEIASCQQLPPLPSVAVRVIELSENPQVQISDIADVIQNDQTLAGKILKTVNSSFYGLSKPCETISRAMLHLGLNTMKSLVLGFSLVRISREHQSSEALVKHWRRVVYSAAAARRIAQELRYCDPEEAFLAAMMQDIGALAMHAAMNGEYARLIEAAGNDHFQLPAIERQELGFDHALVGAALGEQWRLPESLVEVIKYHHSSQRGTHRHLLQTITLGTQVAEIAAASTVGDADCSAMLARFASWGSNWYDMNPADSGELVRRIGADADELADLLNIHLGSKPDIHTILARAEEVSQLRQMRMQREADRLQRQNITLSRMAQTCGLTGLANRRQFDQELRTRVNQAVEQNQSLGIIFVDADHFKQLNGTFGHHAGDVALIRIADRINAVIPEDALACRYGGEEFVVMLPGRDCAEAARIAEDIRLKVTDSPVDLHDAECDQSSTNVTVSLGVAAIDPRTREVLTSPVLLLKAAGRALYHAKLSGRNQVQVFLPSQPRQCAA